MNKNIAERMGLYEHYWSTTQKKWESQGLPKDVNLGEYFNYDIVSVDGAWFNTQSIVNQNILVEEDDERIVTINGWGAKLRNWKHKDGTPEHLDFELRDDTIWREKYRENLLDVNTDRFIDLDQFQKNFDDEKETGKFVVYGNLLIFEIMRQSMGDVIMLQSMITDPKWIHDFCDVVMNMIIMHYQYLFENIGVPDGMFFYEDMGYTQAPFVSAEMQREFVFPYHKRLFQFIHEYDIPVIMHSCGKIRSFLPAIYESGVDCLQVLEAKAGQHVVEFAEAVDNQMAFMGNLDIRAFESNDHKTLEAEVIPKLSAIKQKKIPYVFHSDHSIPETVHLDTYRYALELLKEYGRY